MVLRKVLCGLLLAPAFVLATPMQAAHADASNLPGETGKIHLYEDDRFQGCYQARSSYDSNFGNDFCGGIAYFTDRLSSYVNKTGSWWILYEDDDFRGARVCVRPRSFDRNLGDNTEYEDDISSAEKVGPDKPGGCRVVVGVENKYA